MEILRESTAVNETCTTIAGPYVSPERTESIPLKGAPSPSSNFFARCCRSCVGFADDDSGGGGLKLIVGCFIVLSAAVTVALAAQIYHGDYQIVPHGSVATDSRECSLVGTAILKKGGNAVDAAVASTLCMGVVNPHVTGLGGGGFMLVYDHRRSNVLEALDFREVAPTGAVLPFTTSVGPSTVGVPGLLRGLASAHRAHGKLAWKDVVMPAADIALSGFQVPSSLVSARGNLPPRTPINAKLRDWVDSLEAGQTVTLASLAASLKIIAEEGPDALYNGSLSSLILDGVKGSTLTPHDLASYHPVNREPLHGSFAGFDIIVPGAPSGGPLLLAALDSVSSLNLSRITSVGSSPALMYQLARAIKQNYPGFYAESGDPDFSSVSTPDFNVTVSAALPETVSSHVAAVDLNDLYVSIVSGHNSLFGSQILTEGGFIMNNALASFDASAPSSNVPATATSVITNPIIYKNQYPDSDTNSTITFAKVATLPDGAVQLDHSALHDAPESDLAHLDTLTHPLSHPDLLPFPSSRNEGRKKRSGGMENEPRAAIWGSSVANNGIMSGKRPVSLATPVIAVESGQICGRRLVLGGSDAGVIAQVLAQLLVLDGNLLTSIEAPRIQLGASGSELALEQRSRLSAAVKQQLATMGLAIQPPSVFNPSINIVEKRGDTLLSHSDSRGDGVASRF